MSGLLEGKKLLVTGGSRGIGKAIAVKALENGAIVYNLDLGIDPDMAEMETLAKANNTEIFGYTADVSNEEQVVEACKKILEHAGSIDILVNNAGITRDGLMMRMKTKDWDDVININLKSAFLMSREISRAMMKKRTGSIINMSSVVGVQGNAGQTNYCASKAGLLGLTKALAKEIGSRNVRVNAIAPGFITSPMTDKLSEEVQANYKSAIPLAAFGEADDIANAVLYLASDMSKYVTGQVLGVNGGLNM
ncbi:3-oxoacyl-[acyl-carrier-protein] reductase [Thiospirochaeta perfilievii]|uniref:3-oxoacyl-[acyl-carrier-protein] reductase n=1 Tax=Thiospirochaeta perfilievii TaxID=252967 RepID=A0A5C1Q8L1_9SPIO|nr:3-oxoacyl-[acyl-carrier-protein] reductase [Thiospirochaeta perfilievii]QEN03767.1 3-oxoacyl-[acyl-carrier-protein] reductase [Thiospirochaeta perfilievii]